MDGFVSRGGRVFQVLGFTLLVLFVANFINDLSLDEGYDSLWVCHISNLLLALGLFLRQKKIIQVALLWIIPGTVFWFIDAVLNYFSLTSTLSHLGGLLIGLYAIYQMRAVGNVWYMALLYFFMLQIIARASTPPEANVNVAHAVWNGWQGIFSVYWQYWIFIAASAILVLWVVEKILLKLFPGNLVSEKGN